MEKNYRSKSFDQDCTICDNGMDTYWDDGCYRIYYDNGREKEAKVMWNNKTMWNYTFRDENGNITKEYNERRDGKIDSGYRIMEAFDFESDTRNWKFSFEKMTKSYGRDFINMMKIMWEINIECQTEEEFCEMNGIPKSFFEKTIKK